MNTCVVLGWTTGMTGALIGLAGGIVGTYFGIVKTNGPRERSFMIKSSVVGWVGILAFVGLQLVLSHPYRLLLWIPYLILLPVGIVYANRRQQAIMHEESGLGAGKVD